MKRLDDNLLPLMFHWIREIMFTKFSHLSPRMCLVTATDLYVSRREGAGRARGGPGAPGTGRGWSTGCWAEEGSLLMEETQNMSVQGDLHRN